MNKFKAIEIKVCTIRFFTKITEKHYSQYCYKTLHTYIIKFRSIRRHESPECGVKLWLYFFFNLRTRWWWMIKAMQWPSYPSKEIRLPLYKFWVGASARRSGKENLIPTWFQSHNRPVHMYTKQLSLKILCVSELKKNTGKATEGNFHKFRSWIKQVIVSYITSY